MADVDDLWYEDDPDDPDKKRPSGRHGKGKRWQARWRDPAGRQRKLSFHKKRDAENHLSKMAEAKAAGTYVDPAAGRVTFGKFAEQWRLARTHDVATEDRIEWEFRCHVYEDPANRGKTRSGGPSIGQYQIGALSRSPSTIQAWIKGIPLAASSAHVVIGDVSQVFTAAMDDGIIARNPLSAKSIQKPVVTRREAVALDAGQAVAVAAGLPARDRAMAELAEACGHRQGEAFAAAVEDIDFLRRIVHVGVQVKYAGGKLYFAPTKNRKTREVPVADPVLFILSEQIRRYPPVEVTLPWYDRKDPRHGKPVTRRLLFTRVDGRPYTRSTFNAKWRRALTKAGLPSGEQLYGFHVERHTCASRFLANGVGLARVAAILGDTKEVVVSTYMHFMPDDDDRARAVMGEFFKGRGSAPAGASAQNVPADPPVIPKVAGESAI